MQLSDNAKMLDENQKKLLLSIVNKRLEVKSLANQVWLLRIVEIDYMSTPSIGFENNQKTVITLYISQHHFSKPNIKFVIHHELQHIKDRLNPNFGYDKFKKQQLGQQYGEDLSAIVAHLWDIYINGRLDREGLYEPDPTETIGIKGRLLKSSKRTERLAGINFLECRRVCDAKRLYNKVWRAKEGELSYDQLVQLALVHMPGLKK